MTKRFAKEIAEELKQKVVTKAYQGALEKEKLEVLNVVSVERARSRRDSRRRSRSPWT